MRTVLVDVAVRPDLVGDDVSDGVGSGLADIDLATWHNESPLAWSICNGAAARRGEGLRLQSDDR